MALLTIKSAQWDLVKLRGWTENWLQDQLLAVPGVAETEVTGGLKREIRVNLDQKALAKYNLTLAGVLKRLREENVEMFAGRVITGRKEFITRTVGEFTNLEEIRSVVLAKKGQAQVLVRDIAEVTDAHEEVRVITRLNGQPCVELSVLKQSDANTVEVAKAVKQRIKQLQPVLPKEVELGMIENQADYIESALAGVRSTDILAAVLVVIVTYFFFGTWWQVLVMLLALLVTLILNFGLMKLANFSLNIFSLGGLVIAIGVLFSNTVVVVENATRWRAVQRNLEEKECTIRATEEVGIAITAATLTFLALFLPFLLVPGLVSLLFKELILVIAGIFLLSLLVAVSVTPLLTAKLMPKTSSLRKELSRFERFFNRAPDNYGRGLRFLISKRWLVFFGFALVLIVSGFLFPRLGSEFLPLMDDGRIMIKVKLPTGVSVWETDKILNQLEEIIEGDKLVDIYFTLVGGKVWGLYTYEIANEGEIDIQLVPRNKRNISTKKYIEQLRPKVAKIQVPGGNAMVMQMKVKGIRKLGEADIEVKIRGQEIEQLFNLAKQTAEKVNDLPELTNVYVSLDMTKPEYQVRIDRTKAADLGISVEDASTFLKSLISGAVVTKFREGNEYYSLRVLIPETDIISREDVENLIVEAGRNGYIRLSDISRVVMATGPVEIIREDQVKQVLVRMDAAGVSIGQALKKLQTALAKIKIPPGYEITFGGQAQMMREMKNTILGILIFAFLFSFIVLAVQFNSFKLPGLILGSVPFCASGMAYLLLFTGLPLGAPVIIGILVVIAALANDGVLLLTFIGQLEQTKSFMPEEAAIKAGMLGLRPIVMTTVPVIIGFIPLLLNLGGGGEMLQPMAAAAIGGLVFEIVVALFLLPCLYVTFTKTRREVKNANSNS
ncbi:MAG: efflux RND transporter permease subunit [Candidatus Omnitrophica bacterium]|nr:efflux RND transporter permease subunit [Candidatus Omnitrophota bacterium]